MKYAATWALAAHLLFASTALAQDKRALDAAIDEILQGNNLADATRILTLNKEAFVQSELDAFADDLARLAATHEDMWVRFRAEATLVNAANGAYNGTPYLRAQDLLIGLHKAAIGTKDE